MTNSDEVRVLGTFVPSEWQMDRIETEFRALPCLPACCRTERVSVRHPGQIPPDANLAWHQDGMPAYHMVVWANRWPTEIRTKDGDVFIGSDGDVIWFDNTSAFHRQPSYTDEAQRWFVSIRCSGIVR